jgi:hypothetical protein
MGRQADRVTHEVSARALLYWILFWLSLSNLHAQTNLARGAAVDASGPTWGTFVPASLTDGNPSTFVHPLADSATLGYYFEIDLGHTYQLDRILLRNRSDGCCPERLSNYRVELYADGGGETGALNWSGNIRTDGSNCGPGGVDTVRATNSATGTFVGRFVRIVNNNNAPYSPQIAEVEVYGGVPPQIRTLTAEPDAIRSGESSVLSWEISGAASAVLTPPGTAVDATKGEITVRPDATTTYTLLATNESGDSSATVTVGVDVRLSPPEISEFMAENGGKLKDEDGDSSDWIEIRNPNSFSFEMENYYLTDDPQRLTQWPFPRVRIPPHGYLALFASGKDRRNPGGELHTNFRLDAKGDYLALVDPSQHVVQQFPATFPNPDKFPAQLKNVSYGLGSNQVFGYFRAATPGAVNGAAFAGVVADTKFSQDRGFYETNFSVTLSCATPDAVIRYSLDRADVTPTSGQVYSGPIPITGTTILRAAAFKEGWAPTDVDTHTYVFLSNVISSSVMRTNITRHPTYSIQIRAGLLDVPSVSLVTSGTINDSAEVKTSFEWLPGGANDGEKGIHADCGIRYFGGAFTSFAKKSFRLYFRSDYGTAKLHYPLFEGFDHDLAAADQFDQLELRSGSHDMVTRGFYMANIFTDDTLLDMGQLNPHGRFVHLYLNGTYWGLFHLRERWNASMHQSYLGGARSNYESINGNWNVGGWADPGTPYDGDGSTWNRIKELRSNYSAVKPLLDVPQYIDYMLMWLFGGAEDEYRCVGPNVPGSGFKYYLNDADGWFCGSWYCAAGDRTARGAPGRSGGDGPGSIFSMLFKEGHPDYRVLLADRIYRSLMNDGALTPSRNAARLLARCTEIERAFLAESARWNYLSPSEWASRRDQVLKNWLTTRTGQVLSDFRGAGFYPALDAPILNQQGGLVPSGFEAQFTAPARGTIFYTLDGSDPRLPGGEVAPRAKSYSSGRTGEIAVPQGSVWRWFTDAVGLGSSEIVAGHENWSAANWKHPDFDDSSWKEGPAQLGYGEGDEATIIPYGPNANQKWTASYFRHRFSLAATQDIVAVEVRVKRDDGAIIYINGQEAIRSAIPTQAVSGSTFAQAITDDGQVFNSFTVPTSLLIPGSNLIAVELHQAALTTSDASFDLELQITRASTDNSPNSLAPISASTLIKSRVKDGPAWSALNEAFFQVGSDGLLPGELALSELNYDFVRNGSEFIELSNLSGRALNLRGVSFIHGLGFSFPRDRDTLLAPAQRLVLVKDLFEFQRVYGLDVPVGGIYSGSLSRTGEEIAWASGSNILSRINYSVRPPWPSIPVQSNFSLVLSHPELDPNNPAAWRLSAEPNGTPGGTDSLSFSGIATEDRDGDGFPALLEYALGTSDLDPASGPGNLNAALDANGNLTLSFPRRLSADDVMLQCEATEDLLSWVPATLLSADYAGSDLSRETWGAPSSGHRALFLRLTVRRAGTGLQLPLR